MLPTTNKKTVGKKTAAKKTTSKQTVGKPATEKKNGLAARNGLLARRQRENRFVGATEAETDQRVEEYNRVGFASAGENKQWKS